MRLDRPVRAYEKWVRRIPGEYRAHVFVQTLEEESHLASDPHRLALLRHYRSLMPMAQEARKPIFHLKPADGAIGSHALAVQDVRREFRDLAVALLERIGLRLPAPA